MNSQLGHFYEQLRYNLGILGDVCLTSYSVLHRATSILRYLSKYFTRG